MVKEYLSSTLEKAGNQLKQYRNEYNQKKNTKAAIEEQIEKILANGDIDVEYFSPRNSNQSLRERLSKLYEELGKTEKEMEELDGKIQVFEKEQQTFSQMLSEVEELEKRANVSRETFSS